ncbi:MAG: hypothetical protein ABSA45_00975 [Verrucomicrobiota bacterium]|jgi:hypothetical protein
MINVTRHNVGLFILTTALGTAFLGGCATKPPLSVAPGFNPQSIDTLYVLPLANLVPTKNADAKSYTILTRNTKYYFKTRRYNYQFLADPQLVANITAEDVEQAQPDWIKTVGPPEARWVMLFALGDLSKHSNIIIGTFNVEMDMLVFDKQQGLVMWRDKEVLQTGGLGVVGAVVNTFTPSENGVETTVLRLLHRFPKRQSN